MIYQKGDKDSGFGNKLANEIFTDMVMQEALKDKEIAINKQLKDQGNF